MIVPTTVVTEPTTAVTSAAALNCQIARPNTIPSKKNDAMISHAPYLIRTRSALGARFAAGAG